MELIMKTDIEKSIPAVIEFNFEEMKAELEQKLKRYNSLVVTEDGIKDAKSDKASLNTLSKTLNDNRIALERTYMQPFNNYKGKINQLITLIKEPVNAIDGQIKVFEDKEKQDKFEEIAHFYNDNIKGLRDVLPLEKLLNPKWANKGTTTLSITQELIDKIMTVQNDLKIISAMKLDCEVQVKDIYLRNLSMSEALAEKTRFEEQQKRFDELKAKETPQVEPIIESYKVEKSFTPPVETVQPTVVQGTFKTITATFYNTTAEFRAEMTALIKKHNIVCE